MGAINNTNFSQYVKTEVKEENTKVEDKKENKAE